VGWSKAYLQLTHTTCLTKYKLKRDEQKQNKEKQKQVLPQKKKFKKIKILPQILFFFFCFSNFGPPPKLFFSIWLPQVGGAGSAPGFCRGVRYIFLFYFPVKLKA
jgi:hypothetical protein